MTLPNFVRKPLRMLALCGSIGVIIAGCAELPSTAEIQATNDQCSQFRQPFLAIARDRNERIAGWAQVGAGAGALAGAAIANNNNNNSLAGALVGAVLGGFAGAAVGYLSDVQRRAGSTAGLQRTINADASQDLQQVDQLSRSLTALNDCRLKQIASVERQVRAGGSRETATARIAQIRRSVDVDNRIIEGVVGDLTETRNVYVGALRQSGADTSGFVSSIQAYQPRVSTPERTALRIETSQRPRTNNNVERLGYAERELSAGAQAHVASIDARIDALDDLLI